MSSDDEDDNLPNKFGSAKAPDVHPGLVDSGEAELEMEPSSKDAIPEKVSEYHQREQLEKGLASAISKSNIGFSIMAKMGYKEGTSLGKSGQSGIVEPIGITVKAGRKGLGREAAVQELREQRQLMIQEKRLRKSQGGFRMKSVRKSLRNQFVESGRSHQASETSQMKSTPLLATSLPLANTGTDEQILWTLTTSFTNEDPTAIEALKTPTLPFGPTSEIEQNRLVDLPSTTARLNQGARQRKKRAAKRALLMGVGNVPASVGTNFSPIKQRIESKPNRNAKANLDAAPTVSTRKRKVDSINDLSRRNAPKNPRNIGNLVTISSGTSRGTVDKGNTQSCSNVARQNCTLVFKALDRPDGYSRADSELVRDRLSKAVVDAQMLGNAILLKDPGGFRQMFKITAVDHKSKEWLMTNSPSILAGVWPGARFLILEASDLPKMMRATMVIRRDRNIDPKSVLPLIKGSNGSLSTEQWIIHKVFESQSSEQGELVIVSVPEEDRKILKSLGDVVYIGLNEVAIKFTDSKR